MNVLENAPQGSQPWHDARLKHFCASEASAAAGESKYMSRDELLRFKATGVAAEVSADKQRLFDAGHDSEKATRPIAEGILGTDLYPVVATLHIDGMNLLASLDGVDMLETVIWENKLLNQSLVAQCKAGDLDAHYYLQIEHQLLVSGAERCLFTTSNGTEEGTHSLWYESKPERRAKLLAVWQQFAKDLAAWTPDSTPVAEPKPTGKVLPTLPALNVKITGEVTASNLDEYKTAALAIIRSVNRDLKTDQDFADSAKARQWCEKIEKSMAGVKEQALGEMVSVDTFLKAVDAISSEARLVRLELEKLEKAKTLSINSELVADGIAKFRAHIDALNATMPAPYMPKIAADFGGCIAKLRSVDSKRNAVNTELARAKIAADEAARSILFNLRILDARPDLAHLFNDRATIVLKQPEDLGVLVKLRISEHEAAEAKKAEALRSSIAAEEKAKAEKKARDELAAQQAADAAEAARQTREAAAATPAPVAAPAPAPAPVVVQPIIEPAAEPFRPTLANIGGFNLPGNVTVCQASIEDDGSRIKLGDINARIAPLSIDAAGLAALGWVHVGTDKSAKLFREIDLPQILASMLGHLQKAHRVAADEAAKASGLPF